MSMPEVPRENGGDINGTRLFRMPITPKSESALTDVCFD